MYDDNRLDAGEGPPRLHHGVNPTSAAQSSPTRIAEGTFTFSENRGQDSRVVWLERWTRFVVGTLTLTLALGVAAEAKPRQLEFHGKQLYERKTGLTVIPDEIQEHVIVSSRRHHFWVVLPYSESWILETGKKVPLVARDDSYSVSVSIVRRKEEDPAEHLARLLEELQASKHTEVREGVLLHSHGRPVLRYQARDADPGDASPWHWHYRSVAPQGGHWYVLELSFPSAGELADAVDVERVLDILGAGFGADFQLD